MSDVNTSTSDDNSESLLGVPFDLYKTELVEPAFTPEELDCMEDILSSGSEVVEVMEDKGNPVMESAFTYSKRKRDVPQTSSPIDDDDGEVSTNNKLNNNYTIYIFAFVMHRIYIVYT